MLLSESGWSTVGCAGWAECGQAHHISKTVFVLCVLLFKLRIFKCSLDVKWQT